MFFIKAEKNTIIDKEIPIEKFLNPGYSEDALAKIERVVWYANIKPGVSDVKASVTETQRYEEIQLLEIVVKERKDLFDVGKVVFSNIKYPCVVEFEVDDVICIGACAFRPGKNDYSENVNKKIVFSHFLHRDLISPQAQEMVGHINEILTAGESTIAEIYSEIIVKLQDYKLGGTSRAHVDRLIEDMIGKSSSTRKNEIRRYCVPYEYHSPIPGSGKYGNKRKNSNYTLVHDYEEVWYCFMKDPQLSSIIEKRGYKNMERLVYSIDSKGW